jgi:hypothetical protein
MLRNIDKLDHNDYISIGENSLTAFISSIYCATGSIFTNGELTTQTNYIASRISEIILAHFASIIGAPRCDTECNSEHFIILYRRNEQYIGYNIMHIDILFENIMSVFMMPNSYMLNNIFNTACENYMIYHHLSHCKMHYDEFYNHIIINTLKYPLACNNVLYNSSTQHPMCSKYCQSCTWGHDSSLLLAPEMPLTQSLIERAGAAKALIELGE